MPRSSRPQADGVVEDERALPSALHLASRRHHGQSRGIRGLHRGEHGHARRFDAPQVQ
nr:hypothetical protein [Caballeronia sp. dw_19]